MWSVWPLGMPTTHIYLCAHKNVNALVLAQFMYFHVRAFSQVSCFNYLSATRFDSRASDMKFQGGTPHISAKIETKSSSSNGHGSLLALPDFQTFLRSSLTEQKCGKKCWFGERRTSRCVLTRFKGDISSLLSEQLIDLCIHIKWNMLCISAYTQIKFCL